MHRFIRSFPTAILLLSLLLCRGNCLAAAASLETHQGRYFKWLSPPEWQVSETASGVTLTSPDGKYTAALAVELRSKGKRTPGAFLQWMFAQAADFENVKIISVTHLPRLHLGNRKWDFVQAIVSYTDSGLPVTGLWKAGVTNYSGMNDAMIVGYSAANPDFKQARSFMPAIAGSLVPVNGTGFPGHDRVIRSKNNPADNSGLIQSGQILDNTGGYAGEAQREGMMGTGPVIVINPETGMQRDTPPGDNHTERDGYVEPERSNELLVPDHQ